MLEDLLKEPFEPELPPLALAIPVVVRIRARAVSCRMERFIGISFAARGSGLVVFCEHRGRAAFINFWAASPASPPYSGLAHRCDSQFSSARRRSEGSFRF